MIFIFNNVVGDLLIINIKVKVIYLIVVKVNKVCWEDFQENNERENFRDQNYGIVEFVKRDIFYFSMDKFLESRFRFVFG